MDNQENVYNSSLLYNSTQDQKQSQLNEKLLNQPSYYIIQNEADFQHRNIPQNNKFLCFRKTKFDWQEQPDRLIQTNVQDMEVIDNSIHTAKYNFFSFIPLNLMEQFSKLPNVYFLLVGFLQMIDEISNSEGRPVIFFPLTIILCVTAIKDAYEDMKRHMYDKQENNKPILVARNKNFMKEQWRNLRIGNLIRVNKDEYIPADIILIYSSNKGGNCYVETKNLDGETNLKVKSVPKKLQNAFQTHSQIFNTFSVCRYEKPNPFLYKFQGYIEYEHQLKMIQQPLEIGNFILRGCSLKQTDYIIGVVAYTGSDTKIMLNSVKARPKLSTIQILMNSEIILVFLVQMLFCIICALLEQSWTGDNFSSISFYLGLTEKDQKHNDSFVGFLIYYGMWMMLFTNFVPISLLVTLDMVKFFQSMKITKDKHMLGQDGSEPLVQSSGLNEELGQVGFIFTDKTGTLTCNQLVFKAFGLQDKVYGLEKCHQQDRFEDDKFDQEIKQIQNIQLNKSNRFQGADFYKEFNSLSNKEKLEDFMIYLAMCHEIIVEHDKEKLVYNACSPDDLCLVEFAKEQGFELLGMDHENILSIKKNLENEQEVVFKYKILNILPFSSARKRMSIIYQKILTNSNNIDVVQEEIYIATKGADSIIMNRLDQKLQDQFVLQKTHDFLCEFAKLGYRTLVLAKGRVDNHFYDQWNEKMHESQIILTSERDEMVEKVSDEIEQNLILYGCTAIEDKLQENVPQTIQKLREAGIQIWMLTGDKRETAINVGLLSSIIEPSYKRVVIDFEFSKYSDILALLKQAKKELLSCEQDRKTALIVSGVALDQMSHQPIETHSDELLTLFMKLAQYVDSVIVCRVSPKQKRQIVDLFRQKNPGATTLAIGDGANDVNMIIGAHVGIGIKGLEGTQAARASDFAINEFQQLGRLLLYYGREFYRKNSNLVLYNFYKNILVVLPQFWYGFYNGFSAQFLYDLWIFQMYNIVFTSAPIVVFALFDKEYKGKFLQQNPYPYYLGGILNEYFDKKTFWQQFLIAILQSALIGICCIQIFDTSLDNLDTYMLLVGNFMYSNVIIISNIKIFLISKCITPLLIAFTVGSILIYFIIFKLLNSLVFLDGYHIFNRLYGQIEVWLGHVFIVIGCLLIDYIIVNFKRITYQLNQNEESIKKIIQIPFQKIRLSYSINQNQSEYSSSSRMIEMNDIKSFSQRASIQNQQPQYFSQRNSSHVLISTPQNQQQQYFTSPSSRSFNNLSQSLNKIQK
ncbi:hypothetical protein ABPG74_017754 [Tetrahymena malaccensis]